MRIKYLRLIKFFVFGEAATVTIVAVEESSSLLLMLCLAMLKWSSRFLPLRGLLVFVGGIIVLLCVGSLRTFGNIAPYIVSYIQERSHPANLKDEYVVLIYAISFIGEGGGNIIGGWLVDKIGPKWTSMISGIVISLSVSLSYFTIKVSFWLLILTYGFLYGLGGIGSIGPVSSVTKWTPNWKGLASGIVISGYTLSPLVFNNVQTLYINPDNVSPVPSGSRYKKFTDPDLLHRVPISFLVLGSIYAVVMFIGSLLITDPPEDYNDSGQPDDRVIPEVTEYLEVDDIDEINMKRLSVLTKHVSRRFSCCDSSYESSDDSEAELELLNSKALANREKSLDKSTSSSVSQSWTYDDVISLRTRQVLRIPYFYILCAIYFLSINFEFIVTYNYKFFGEDFIEDDHFVTLVGSAASIFGVIGRLFWGITADYLSYTFVLTFTSGILTAFILTFYACTVVGKVMFLIWTCIIFFSFSGVFSVYPVAIGHAYGLQYMHTTFGSLVGFKFLVGPFSAVIILTLSSHYFYIFMLASGLTGLLFILSIIYKPKLYVAINKEEKDEELY